MNVLFVNINKNELATCLFNVETSEFLLSTRHEISENYAGAVHELDRTLMGHSTTIDGWVHWGNKTRNILDDLYQKTFVFPDFWFLPSLCLKDEWKKQIGKMKFKQAMLSCGMIDFSDMSPYRKVHTMTTLNKFMDASKYEFK